MSGVREGWVDILNDCDDTGVMLLMDDHNIYVTSNDYLIVNEKSYQTSTYLLDKIRRIKDKKILIDREKNLKKII